LLARAKAGMRPGVANGEEFEFERKQCEAAILGKLRVVLAESAEPVCRTMVAAKQEGDLFDAAPDPAFQQSEENILLAKFA
jgi:hypothetical protein